MTSTTAPGTGAPTPGVLVPVVPGLAALRDALEPLGAQVRTALTVPGLVPTPSALVPAVPGGVSSRCLGLGPLVTPSNRAERRIWARVARGKIAQRLRGLATSVGITRHDADRMTPAELLTATAARLPAAGRARADLARARAEVWATLRDRIAHARTRPNPSRAPSPPLPSQTDPDRLTRVLIAAPGAPGAAARTGCGVSR